MSRKITRICKSCGGRTKVYCTREVADSEIARYLSCESCHVQSKTIEVSVDGARKKNLELMVDIRCRDRDLIARDRELIARDIEIKQLNKELNLAILELSTLKDCNVGGPMDINLDDII